MLAAIRGHLWTIYPWLKSLIRCRRHSSAVAWETSVQDSCLGRIRVRGEISRHPNCDRAVVIVHGLGGGMGSFYCRSAARRIYNQGWTALNLGLRGADLESTDYYHGALTDDVHACVTELARDHARVHVLGFSVGGHIALHVANESRNVSLRSVAAISSPLDLTVASAHIDSPKAAFYRRHVLAGCKRVYAAVAARAVVPTPLAEVLKARTIHELDSLTVVPRYGFVDTEDYYRLCSVAPHLERLERPALYVGARHDPMVPEHLVRPYFPRNNATFEAHVVEHGGHVGFPRSLDLGLAPRPGLINQVLGFFERT